MSSTLIESEPVITNAQSKTSICQILPNVYRISTPVEPNPMLPNGFTFNQFLLVDNDPLLFHAGLRSLFPLVKEAVERVMPVANLKYIGFSHVEADECGALNNWLEVAPNAVPLCSELGAAVSVNDMANKPAKGLKDGEKISTGTHTLQWHSTPHIPHGWETGYLFDLTNELLFGGDLLTQQGHKVPGILTNPNVDDIKKSLFPDPTYFAQDIRTVRTIEEKLVPLHSKVITNMHGSAIVGDIRTLLRAIPDVYGIPR